MMRLDFSVMEKQGGIQNMEWEACTLWFFLYLSGSGKDSDFSMDQRNIKNNIVIKA